MIGNHDGSVRLSKAVFGDKGQLGVSFPKPEVGGECNSRIWAGELREGSTGTFTPGGVWVLRTGLGGGGLSPENPSDRLRTANPKASNNACKREGKKGSLYLTKQKILHRDAIIGLLRELQKKSSGGK